MPMDTTAHYLPQKAGSLYPKRDLYQRIFQSIGYKTTSIGFYPYLFV